uniref:Uncharacterized protein n=1 Tax=Anguilla anguilla TaxID=7936 RepID=A0A0E9SIT9_ANGAN
MGMGCAVCRGLLTFVLKLIDATMLSIRAPRVLVSFMIAVWYAVTLFWLRAT